MESYEINTSPSGGDEPFVVLRHCRGKASGVEADAAAA
jgi:hypothetical protein